MIKCDRCGEEFEPSGEMVTCGGYLEDWKWRNPTEIEIESQMESEGWWSGDEGILCPECCDELADKGIYPEDWELEAEIEAERMETVKC